MRNPETGDIDLPEESGVRWVARLGSQSYGSPVVAGGKVFVGTNNGMPRDERNQGDRGVLMCFDEKTGEFLWQLVVPKLEMRRSSGPIGGMIGLTSPPVVEGDRAYLVSNRCEVVCLDVDGMADGNDGPYTDEARHASPRGQPPLEPGANDGDIVWLFDIIEETKAEPHNGANCSVLVHGDLLYVCTSNGVEWTHMEVLHPEAPSLIVLDKKTGKLVARDDFGIGPDITHGQWSSPAMGRVGGKELGFFGAGNGVSVRVRDARSGPCRRRARAAGERVAVPRSSAAQTEDRVPVGSPARQHVVPGDGDAGFLQGSRLRAVSRRSRSTG